MQPQLLVSPVTRFCARQAPYVLVKNADAASASVTEVVASDAQGSAALFQNLQSIHRSAPKELC